MPESDFDPLELFWDALLSREPERIRAVFLPLNSATRKALTEHLQRMASEPDWHPEQRKSAQAALLVIQEIDAP